VRELVLFTTVIRAQAGLKVPKCQYEPAIQRVCAISCRQDDGNSRILLGEAGLIGMIRTFDCPHARFAVANSSNPRTV
jgi:hypothetical protein